MQVFLGKRPFVYGIVAACALSPSKGEVDNYLVTPEPECHDAHCSTNGSATALLQVGQQRHSTRSIPPPLASRDILGPVNMGNHILGSQGGTYRQELAGMHAYMYTKGMPTDKASNLPSVQLRPAPEKAPARIDLLGIPELHALDKARQPISMLGSGKYWQLTACPPACRYPEVVLGAPSNGGKDLENGICTFFASRTFPEQENRRFCGEGPEYKDGNFLDCSVCGSGRSVSPPQQSWTLHDVVGPDGVKMISLGSRVERFEYSSHRLNEVGINPSFFPATEAAAPQEELGRGCLAQNGQCWSPDKPAWRVGEGCKDTLEQAIADSHRRALEAAQYRDAEWTAIFEDDAIPAMSEDGQWMQRLMQTWAQVPPETDVVRLGWCSLHDPVWRQSPGDHSFVLADTPGDIGGCTHAYLVHKKAISRLLAVFPCCCPVDCCFKFGMPAQGISMVNIDAPGSREYIASHEPPDWANDYGVMMQAKTSLPSIRGR